MPSADSEYQQDILEYEQQLEEGAGVAAGRTGAVGDFAALNNLFQVLGILGAATGVKGLGEGIKSVGHALGAVGYGVDEGFSDPESREAMTALTGLAKTAVSYTHLTLPTIYSV